MEIRTNNVPRWLIDDYELTTEERAEFDYLDWSAIEAGTASATFFRYKKQLYDLGEFTRIDHATPDFEGWNAWHSDTAFSGILIRLVNDERIVVGQYFY